MAMNKSKEALDNSSDNPFHPHHRTTKEKVVDSDLTTAITKDINLIDLALKPVRQLKKLSPDPSTFSELTLAPLGATALASLTVGLVQTLFSCKKSFQTIRSTLEDLEPIQELEHSDSISQVLLSDLSDLKNQFEKFVIDQPVPQEFVDNTPQIQSELSQLNIKIDEFVNNKSRPLDYADAVSQPSQLNVKPAVVKPVDIRKEYKAVSEAETRSKNIILYRVAYDKNKLIRASDHAKEYFKSCGITHFHLESDKIVDAEYLKISGDRCDLKVLMTSPLVVRNLLSVSRQLKTTESHSCFDKPFDFGTTFVSKDRTKHEQQQHARLVREMKERIKKDKNIKWVIRYGRVEAAGEWFSKDLKC